MQWSWARTVDALICVGVVSTGLTEVLGPLESRQGDGSAALTSIQVVAIGAALWWRRTRPLPAAAAVFASIWLLDLFGSAYVLFYGGLVPMVVATFSVARFGRGREPYVGAALAAGAMLYADLRLELLQSVGELVFHWGVLVTAWSFGSWQRVMADRAEASLRRAVEVEVSTAERTMSAVLEERSRIARELHDIVAHSMSVMVVQAGAAEQVVADSPDEARQALRQIRRTGTEALAEMRRLVGVLRDPDDVGPLAPQPGLDALATLVEDARAAGLPVTFSVSGEPKELPAGLGLTAYRIVQEALTNARRHATAATSVNVGLSYGRKDLRIDVTDDGVGEVSSTDNGGHGLIGMQERVQMYGGRVRAARLPGRGFRVTASLPLAET